MLDQAFAALNTYDWGQDRTALNPIDQAVVDTQGDTAVREKLESRLAAVLQTDVSRAAKDFVCRKLRVVGSSVSVRALAELLPQKEYSHMARYALESMPTSAAAQALRDALPTLEGDMKVGVIGSLGVRQDETSVPSLGQLVASDKGEIARSAADALGAIRSSAAAMALAEAKPQKAAAKSAVANASLSCAEALLASGSKAEARVIYTTLTGGGQPKQVRVAATRGLLACVGK
jgi:HEAT repeat protein